MSADLKRVAIGLHWLLLGCGVPEPPPITGPLSVADDAGRTVVVQAPADRVVSAVPALTELISALGAGNRLVARTRYDEAPELAGLPVVGGTIQPDVETLVALAPDLVVVWGDVSRERIAERLEFMGIAVYRAELQSLGDLWRHLRNLGILLGLEGRAGALADSLRSSLEAVSHAVEGRPSPRVLYVLWHDPPRTAGPDTFIHEIIGWAGGSNVFADAPGAWPAVSMEELLVRDPDALIVAGPIGRGGDPPRWFRDPGWRSLSAVREGRYLLVDDDLFVRPGPRIAEAATRLARFLHGDSVVGRGMGDRAPTRGSESSVPGNGAGRAGPPIPWGRP